VVHSRPALMAIAAMHSQSAQMHTNPGRVHEEAAWKGMVLPYSVFLVLGAAAPARAVANNSRLSEYGSTVPLSSLWKPAMEAGSRSGIHTFGTYICSATNA
jgi:hypothetical protein